MVPGLFASWLTLILFSVSGLLKRSFLRKEAALGGDADSLFSVLNALLWLKLVVLVRVVPLPSRLELKLVDLGVVVLASCCCCCALFMSSRTFFLKFWGDAGVEAPEEVTDEGEDVDEASDEDEEHECCPGEIILFGFEESKSVPNAVLRRDGVVLVVVVLEFVCFNFEAAKPSLFASIEVDFSLGALKLVVLCLKLKLFTAKKSSKLSSSWHLFNLFIFLVNSTVSLKFENKCMER